MNIEIKTSEDGGYDLVISENFLGITMRTREGKELHVCQRDMGFEMRLGNGPWHSVSEESDFAERAGARTVTEQTVRDVLYDDHLIGRLALLYKDNPAIIANVCDEALDKSGALLGYVRKASTYSKPKNDPA